MGKDSNLVMCVPSGNFGNITAGLFAWKMGLPVKRFIAANNSNDIFYKYLKTGEYSPRPSIQTLANAMDVGDPSNFVRILDLYNYSFERIAKDISGATYSDSQISQTMRDVYKKTGYLLDPHGACGFRALTEQLEPQENGVFLETAHPAKFKEKVDVIIGDSIEIPEKLREFMRNEKRSIPLSREYIDFRSLLMEAVKQDV